MVAMYDSILIYILSLLGLSMLMCELSEVYTTNFDILYRPPAVRG